MFGRAPISTPSSHAHVHALTSCGVSARCAQRARQRTRALCHCAPAACAGASGSALFRAPPEPGSQPPASPPPSSVPSPAAPRARLLPPGVQLRRPLRLPPEARVCPPPLLRARPLRLGRRRLEHAHVDGRGRVGGREERVRRPLEVLVVRVAAGGVALGRRLHTAQAGQGGALGQPRVEQPGRGEPLRLRVRAARRELAVAAVGEDPRLRTVPVQHARAAPARLARSHPRARARRRRKRRRRPATRATSLGRAGVHAVGGPAVQPAARLHLAVHAGAQGREAVRAAEELHWRLRLPLRLIPEGVLPVHAEQRLEGCRRAGLPPPVQVEEGDAGVESAACVRHALPHRLALRRADGPGRRAGAGGGGSAEGAADGLVEAPLRPRCIAQRHGDDWLPEMPRGGAFNAISGNLG
mmetsp:Transcript_47382/g.153520  ORF Transcript_47382/g.153520 Transcript_47382/m.153520 type:complete len:412 (-) Transcript_47382:14-1249(-)